VLFQIPGSIIEEGYDGNPDGRFALATSLSPSSFKAITTRKNGSPCFAEEVRNKDNKGT
jgi:hypothetical protein